MPLTDREVKNAKAGSPPLWDGGGLHLATSAKGTKSWRLKYRFAGKEKLLTFGKYPIVTLTDARRMREEAKTLIAQGQDPGEVKKRQKDAERPPSILNPFEEVARDWHKQRSQRWDPGHADRVIRHLEKDVFPIIGALPIAEISPPQVLAMVKAVEARGVKETATRLLQWTGQIFRHAIQHGLCSFNPATDLSGVVVMPRPKHQPALDTKDLPDFLQRLDHYAGDPFTTLGLKLLMLLVSRPGELRAARWEEFDLADGLWRIPAERMKMRAPHEVPLSRQAVAVLEALRPLSGHFDLVLPARTDPRIPISENTWSRAMHRMGYKGKATPHGFRAMFSTTANESGKWNPDAIERALAHVPKNAVRAAYNRAGYLEERRLMMQWWGDFLDRARGLNVVEMPGKGARS